MQRENTLTRLSELSDFDLADGEPDVRGWNVKTADGKDCGNVNDLIVDPAAMQVRLLDIVLNVKTLESSEGPHVVIPLGGARLHERDDEVLLIEMTELDVAALPPFKPGEPIDTTSATAPRPDDAKQFYGARGGSGSIERRATLSEEEPISGDGTHKHARWGGPAP